MQYRCKSGFAYGERVIGSGALIEDGDPILSTHADQFTAVDEPSIPGGETASTDRRRSRNERRGHPAEKPAGKQDIAEVTLIGYGAGGESSAEGDDSAEQ